MYQIRAKRKYSNILIAPFGRRMKAALLDLLLVLVLGFFSFMAVDAIYTNSKVGSTANLTFYNIKKDSGLYHSYDESRTTAFLNLDINERDNYVRYFLGLEYFYTQENSGFIYEKSVYYEEGVEFNYRTMVLKEGKDDSFFDFDTPYKTISYSFKANLSPGDRNEVWKNLYIRLTDLSAIQHIKSRKSVKAIYCFKFINQCLQRHNITNPRGAIFLGHGRTLGKFLTGLVVVDKNGYKVVVAYVNCSLLYGIVEIGLNFYGFLCRFYSQAGRSHLHKRQALHGIFSGTYVVDARTSKIFNNINDEENIFH